MIKFKRTPKSQPVTVALCGTRIPATGFDMIGETTVVYRRRRKVDPDVKRLANEMQGQRIIQEAR